MRADELPLRNADVSGAAGAGGAVVVGGGVGEVGVDDHIAVVGRGLDGAAEVACGAGEDFASGGRAASFRVEAAFDLLPALSEEGFRLEVLLEEKYGEVAEKAREVVLELPFQVSFEMLDVAAKILNLHECGKKYCRMKKKLYFCARNTRSAFDYISLKRSGVSFFISPFKTCGLLEIL